MVVVVLVSGKYFTGKHALFSIDPICSAFPSPICVAEHLAPFLPNHPIIPTGGSQAIDSISSAPFGSASILLISWAYIKMLGGRGLAHASKVALLNANYIAHRLKDHYSLRYINRNGRVAHELLIDLAEFDKAAKLKVNDFAKRLQVRFVVSLRLYSMLRGECFPWNLGLWIPPPYMFLAFVNGNAY